MLFQAKNFILKQLVPRIFRNMAWFFYFCDQALHIAHLFENREREMFKLHSFFQYFERFLAQHIAVSYVFYRVKV
jgi:hypothetical protein